MLRPSKVGESSDESDSSNEGRPPPGNESDPEESIKTRAVEPASPEGPHDADEDGGLLVDLAREQHWHVPHTACAQALAADQRRALQGRRVVGGGRRRVMESGRCDEARQRRRGCKAGAARRDETSQDETKQYTAARASWRKRSGTSALPSQSQHSWPLLPHTPCRGSRR